MCHEMGYQIVTVILTHQNSTVNTPFSTSSTEAETGHPSAAAEQIHAPAQHKAGARIVAHGKAPEIAGRLLVGGAAMLHPLQSR